ncbi:hypothetical protein OEW28_08135 [Defluviimonas sp. WL0002]|uniref:Dolichyl-phosphate-mannose-protein mannosyltransferase n=1 Tax=Albidovulum marisflavi TaxID=2984159 RepID=A0ABT2ZBS8_9RHOB|nr:hypothetical protein [Defluviimonas sp. WL0002]MCV2868595.1 hypothetical protein [Defluviimonas sp. WL0002]
MANHDTFAPKLGDFTSSAPPARLSPLRLVVAAMVFLLSVVMAAGMNASVDDTFITLTYARNLVETGFPYWHPSLPPVEGFTSLGHVLLIALVHATGPDPVVASAVVTLTSLALLFAALAHALRGMTFLAYAAGLLTFGACTSLNTWVSNGLDAVPYTLAFFLAYLSTLHAHEARRLSILTALALIGLVLMRPEGMIIAPVVLVHFWLTNRPTSADRRTSVLLTAAPIVVIFALTAWRLWAFGYPLPNTFYAKASATRTIEVLQGLEYTWTWVSSSFGALVLATLIAMRLGLTPVVHLCFVFGTIALVILEGGDSHPESRFFLPLLPLLAVDVARLVNVCSHVPGGNLRAVAIIIASLLFVRQTDNAAVHHGSRLVPPHLLRGVDKITSDQKGTLEMVLGSGASAWAATAQRLAAVAFTDDQIGAVDVGAIAYVTRRPVLDAMGLNHAGIAHAPRPEDFANKWGNLRFDKVAEAAPPIIYPAFPWQTDFSFDDLVTGRHACGPLARDLSFRVAPFVDALEESYLCTAVKDADSGLVLNFLAHRTAYDTARLSGLDYTQSNCLPGLVAACPY